MRRPRVAGAGLVALLLPGMLAAVDAPALAAQQAADGDVTWGGMFRTRFEAREVEGGRSTAFTGMRIRVDARHILSPEVRVFAQLQDVRRWGEETSTLDGSADGLDMHQAYLEAGLRGESRLWARVGRQEIEYRDGRLLGNADFNNFARTFDGARVGVRAGDATVVDAFAVQLRESAAGEDVSDAAYFGAWSQTGLGSGVTVDAFVIHDVVEGAASTARTTVGSEVRGTLGPATWRAQGAWQGGELNGLDLSAWMAAGTVRLPVAADRGSLALWYDHYSGDADPGPGATAGFDDLYNRNHRFLGFADLFTGDASDTGGRGLRDVAVKLGWTVSGDARLGLDLHRFLVADATGLSEATVLDEVDLTLDVPLLEGVNLLAAAVWASPTATGTALGVTEGDVHFGYLWLEAFF